jgi:hypothetical protein
MEAPMSTFVSLEYLKSEFGVSQFTFVFEAPFGSGWSASDNGIKCEEYSGIPYSQKKHLNKIGEFVDVGFSDFSVLFTEGMKAYAFVKAFNGKPCFLKIVTGYVLRKSNQRSVTYLDECLKYIWDIVVYKDIDTEDRVILYCTNPKKIPPS